MTTIKGFASGTAPLPAGTTALDTRKARAFDIATMSTGAARTGVLGSNPSIVTTDASTAPMRLAVAKAGFVTSRGVGDGVIDWGNDGSVFVTVTKPGANSHIVVVYAKHNDAAAGDANSLPVIDVVTGAAAASPTKPAIPTGAEELATLLVPSTATSTQSAGVVLTNTYKMTALRGGVVPFRTVAERNTFTPADDGQLAVVVADGVANGLYTYAGGSWRPLLTRWASYVPTVVNLPNSALTAGFQIIGDFCEVEIEATLSGALPGQPTLTLPVPAVDATAETLMSVFDLVDISAASTFYMGTVDKTSATICRPRAVFTPGGGAASAANVGVAGFPFATVAGDLLRIKFRYRIA